MPINTSDPRVCPYCGGSDQHRIDCKMLTEQFRKVDLFQWVTAFDMPWPRQIDIDVERRSLEDKYKCKLDVFEIRRGGVLGVGGSSVVWKRV